MLEEALSNLSINRVADFENVNTYYTDTMKSFAVLAMCCAGAQAFVPVPSGSFGLKAAPQRAASSSSSTVMMAKSKALPFLESPATLDGSMVGDFGFDPLGLTENINIPYGEPALGLVYSRGVCIISSSADICSLFLNRLRDILIYSISESCYRVKC